MATPVREDLVLDLPRRRVELSRRVLVMGIVNRTPDSFYDRGATFDLDAARGRALALVEHGADIVDVGGVKGGPGEDVTSEQEIERVVPVIAAIRSASDVLISADTFRADVADAALAAGADLVNDVTGGHEPRILDVVAAHDAGYVVMHHGGEPRTRPFRVTYEPDVTTVVIEHLRTLTAAAMAAGVGRDRLMVDPGHDFQKNTYHSLELCRRLDEVAALGFPVLVALSNKDFIGETLEAPIDARTNGSVAAAVSCVLNGARIVRVHDVRATVDAVRMTEAILGWRPPAVAVRGLE